MVKEIVKLKRKRKRKKEIKMRINYVNHQT